MAYTLTYSDGSPLVQLLDGEIDTTSTDLVLLGKNYLGYGDIIANNFVRLIENFAGKLETELNPLPGQLWFDTTTSTIQALTDPSGTLKVNRGTINSPDWWSIPSFTTGTGMFEADIKDVSGNYHKCIKMQIEGVLVAIISSDADFTPHIDEGLLAFCGANTSTGTDANLGAGDYNTTGTIGRGLNMNASSDFKIRGVAVEAEFADVAEIYVSDATYEPGTLVSLGGTAEVTQTTSVADTNVFGIVSTRPAYLMNTKAKGRKNALPIAVAGRIPVKVKGEVQRGDRLIASDVPGVAQAAGIDSPAWSIVGRSLGQFNGAGIGKVEATVGSR